MASKKNSGKGKQNRSNKQNQGAVPARQPEMEKLEEKALLEEENINKEQLPGEEHPQLSGEKALTEADNLENEQLAVISDLAADKPLTEKNSALTQNVEKMEDKAAVEVTQAAKSPGPRLPGGITPRPIRAGNPYLPSLAVVSEVIRETHNINTLRLVLDEPDAMEQFVYEPGQVGQISVFGAGEATFVINSPPSEKRFLQFSVMRTGEVTKAIHNLRAGDRVGLRAPLGNYFPYKDWKGKNIFFIGGGIGMAPIRVIMLHLLERKADYGRISLLYGARSPKDMAYSYELDEWKNNPDLDCTLCIDNPYENWGHKVGLIPKVLEELNPSPENSVAVLCGPPIMIKFTLQTLQKLGFEPENIVTTLEKRMKCGIGICGRCNIGDRFVCVDGPVFTMKELNGLPPDL